MPAFEIITTDGDLILKNKYGCYSKKELESQLLNGHFTIEELGDIYSLKPYQMKHVFNSLGIVEFNPIGNTRVFNPQISPSLHQVFIGTLLGDAYMKTISYSVGHSINQIDYMYHVAERIHPFIASLGDKDHPNTKSFSLWTYSHKVFIPYFNKFYSRGKNKKVFLDSTARDLDPEGLAYWFMDDGKHGKYGFYLCVGDITREEGLILIAILKNNFNIESIFQNHDIEMGYHNIYIKAESREHFLNIISPYIIPSMRYKIVGGGPPKIEFSVNDIANRHLKLCKIAGRTIRYFGNEDVKRVLNEKIDIMDPKNVYKNKILKSINENNQVSKTFFRKLPNREELIKLFEQDFTDADVAKKYGVGRRKIAIIRKSEGINRKKCRITMDKERKIKEVLSRPNITFERAMKELHMSFYQLKKYV